jgi:hypothetical protein
MRWYCHGPNEDDRIFSFSLWLNQAAFDLNQAEENFG